MEYRRLGQSGLLVSTLTLGTMSWGANDYFSAIGTLGLDGARRQIDMALDAGVNLIDTADVYSAGQSEEVLGEVIAGRRERVLVATKVRAPMGAGPNDQGLSRQHIVEACEASLRRLRCDHIDLYQAHGPDSLTPIEETLEAFDTLVRAGKVRYVGLSNYAGWQLAKTVGKADAAGMARPISHQIYYSLLCRDAEWELLPAGVDQGVDAIIWSPLSSGLLSGKYRRGVAEPEGTRMEKWSVPPRPDTEHVHAVVDVLLAIAADRSVTPAQVALAWTLARPGVASLIVGARTEEQLAENLAAATLTLTTEEVARLEEVSRVPLPYPMWQHLGINRDRLSPAETTFLGPWRR